MVWCVLTEIFSVVLAVLALHGQPEHEIDVHVIVFDAQGNGVYGPVSNGQMYPAASLTGTGSIAGTAVRCISQEWMIQFHSGYTLADKDFRDVSVLCEKFGIPLSEEYGKFK
jgi:lincosamide nucleotidyltransferase A/C/D/E